MLNADNISNLLVRDGLSQLQRINSTPSANTDGVKLDKRSQEEMLDFLYRYARQVLYYNERSEAKTINPDGDWQPFFTNSLPFRYAAINKFQAGKLQQHYQASMQIFRQSGDHRQVINSLFEIAIQLNTWYGLLKHTDENAELFKMLKNLIETDLNKAIARLVVIANTIDQKNEYSINSLINNEIWHLSLGTLTALDPFLERLQVYPRRSAQAVSNAFEEIFSILYKGVLRVQQFSGDHFGEVLEGNGQHTAHLGLLYTFLKLFTHVQDSMNRIAGRHLDFFYKEILQLKQRPFVPDHVHLVISLAKQTSSFLLEKDSTVNAGKDKTRNIDFKLENDIAVNKAIVTSLRTYFKDAAGNVYIAPLANSADGLGTAFRDPAQNSWDLLGASEYTDKNNPGADKEDKKQYPFGQTGMILSSPVLLLREGTRTITIQLKLANSLAGVKTAVENPVYMLDEARLKLLQKAGLGTYFNALAPADAQKNWSLVQKPASWVFTDINSIAIAKKITASWLLEPVYSSEKGWLPFAKPIFSVADDGLITITLKMMPGDPALVPGDPKLLNVSYPVTDPLIKINFNHQLRHDFLKTSASGQPDNTDYFDILGDNPIADLSISVSVEDAKDLLLANDEGPVDGKKTFFPFTSSPKLGSAFYFGSDEAFRKTLSALDLKITWDGLPENLNEYYAGYSLPAAVSINDTRFTQNILKEGAWMSGPNNEPLFTMGDCVPAVTGKTCLSKTSLYHIVPAAGEIEPLLHQPAALLPYNNSAVNGYVSIALNTHFYHLEYPTILAKKMLGFNDDFKKFITNSDPTDLGIVEQSAVVKSDTTAADDYAQKLEAGTETSLSTIHTKTTTAKTSAGALDTNVLLLKDFLLPTKPPPQFIPLPPYTPSIKDISFSYTAEAKAKDITLMHTYPYEESNFKLLEEKAENTFFPKLDAGGSLLIALEESLPGSMVTLLFQLAEFTANPDIPAADISWHYLAGNEWKLLQPFKDVVSDTTRGFQVSGIVTIALPWDANADHTILPAGKCWLRASAEKNTNAVCEGIAVAAQAVAAVFADQGNDLSRLAVPLAPGTITATRVPKSDVKKITQDFPSFAARQSETESQFYLRVSERLRHKGRAISLFDYEHLVLEAFPSVFTVTCIPHTKMCLAKPDGELLSSPGWVTLAVIPEIKDYPPTSRQQPKVSRIVLAAIRDYISARASAFAQVQVVNPRYQEVSFRGNIFLRKGRDRVFYREKLKQDVKNFLSPWVLTGSTGIIFGGTLGMSSVLSYIEKLPYVDHITDFVMLDAAGLPQKTVTAELPWSVLIAGNQEYEMAMAEN